MHFISLFATIFPLITATAALPQWSPNPAPRPFIGNEIPFKSLGEHQVTFDDGYDDAHRSLESTACSDGRNGLMTRHGWKTQGDIPKFPYIGGFEAVEGWNSTKCGTCWSVTFERRTVFILAIDQAERGLNIGKKAMDQLTGGEAVKWGKIFAHVSSAPDSMCHPWEDLNGNRGRGNGAGVSEHLG